jgi:hypothetical protein
VVIVFFQKTMTVVVVTTTVCRSDHMEGFGKQQEKSSGQQSTLCGISDFRIKCQKKRERNRNNMA